MKDRLLNNGYKIPEIGYGTMHLNPTVETVKKALNCGYRHLDCAFIYGNEADVGTALQEFGVKREELFVTSKCWNAERGYDKALKAFDKTLADLKLDYLDLYLIHWPAVERNDPDWLNTNLSTWRALESLYRSGRVRAIGLSNFWPKHLKPLLDAAEIAPMVNQLELHVGFTNPETVALCREHEIVVEAWSPLGRGALLENETLKAMAAKYQVSVPQLCVRWCLQNGFVPIVKSSSEERMKANLDVYYFELTEDDMALLNSMEYCGGSALDPEQMKV